MKRVLLHILFFLLPAVVAVGQTTFIPDTNFRKVLQKYGLIDPNGQLNNARAASFQGTGFDRVFDCSFSNISNLAGIEKLTNIWSLACQFNSLTHIDSVARLSNLTTIYCFNNKISHLPALSNLNKLSYLSCGNNVLSSLPDLSNNVPLTYLDISNNSISTIQGLEKLVNLGTLYISRNQLKSLPDLSKLIKLTYFQCFGNQLTTLPGLSKLTQLVWLIAGDNPYVQLEDMTNLTKITWLQLWSSNLSVLPNISNMGGLVVLDLNNNKLRTLPNFDKNTSISVIKVRDNLLDSLPNSVGKLPLTNLHASGNKLHTVPELTAAKTTLKVLALENNLLEALPNLNGFTSMDTLSAYSNRLTFEDIIPALGKARSFNYSPQAAVGTDSDTSLIDKQPFAIILGIDKNLSTNRYMWYKNATLDTTLSKDTLFFPALQLSDSGTYTCRVSNSSVPGLFLFSYPTHLRIVKCLEGSVLSYHATEVQCQQGAEITIQEAGIKKGKRPYSYTLTATETGKKLYSSSPSFKNLFELAYQIELTDATGCKMSNTIALKGKTAKDCKGLVIVDDDNSPNNNVFLDEQGTARIYDKTGQLVQTLSTPATWDGTNQHGEFRPGYYVIDLNGKMLNVTLIK